MMAPDIYPILGLGLLVIDMVITGIIGLKKREMRPKSVFLGLLFIPLGAVGSIIRFFFDKMDRKPVKGREAILAGISTICVGFLIFTVSGFYYLDIYEILPPQLIKVLVPVSLTLIIFVLIFSVAYCVSD